jgi:hypothetical protein
MQSAASGAQRGIGVGIFVARARASKLHDSANTMVIESQE